MKPTSESQKSESERHNRQDWGIVLLILLFGFLCVLLAGQWALRLSPAWTLNANMESNLNPNVDFLTGKPSGYVEPVDAGILTQPAWVKVFLTPGASFVTGTPPPPVVFADTIIPTQATPTVPLTSTIVAVTNTVAPTDTLIWYPPPPGASSTPKPKKTKEPPADTPIPSVDLQITMNDGGVIYPPGGNLIYTIIVTNNSASDVTGATVNDAFGAQITGASWTCAPSVPTATCSNGAGNPFSDTITLPAGSFVTYTITANVSPYSVGPLPNTATVAAAFETNPGDNTATVSTAGPGGGAGGQVNIGPGDSSVYTPPSGSSITMLISPAIVGNGTSNYDLVYYERVASTVPVFPVTDPRVDLDMVQIEISPDGSAWFTVFYWGDGSSDSNTNVALPAGPWCPAETDNCGIPTGTLHNTSGIAIDIDSLGLSGSYPWVRITCPAGDSGGDGCDIDSIQPYYP